MLNNFFFSRGIFIPLLFIIVFSVFISPSLEAQDILKISARVVNDKTGEYLIGAVVYDTLSKNGTYTNEVGYFYLEMRKDAAIFISHIGYESIWLSANEQLKKNTLIRLIPNNNLIEGVEIISRRPKYEINKIYFTPLELKSTIILGGESDVLKSLTLTPGIKSGVEGTSNIYVRGGNSDQNLILIEGVPIYNTSHLFGLVSIFPNDQIQSVSTYKGSFPAKYGGRLSSVIDMRLKNGNTSKTERSFTLGILSSKANINGSLFEDRLRYNVFYRRNLFDVFSKLQSNQNGEPSIHFSDFNTKLTYQLGNSNFIQFFCLITDEIWKRNSNFNSGNTNNQSSTRYNWGNNIYQLRMYGSFLNKGSYDLNLYSYNYKSHLGSSSHLGVNSIDFKKEFLFSNSIRENTTKIDFKYPLSQKWEVSSGIELKDQTFLPGQTSIQQSIKEQVILDSNSIINQYKVLDTRIYFNNEYIWNKFSFNAGLNVNINKYLPSNFTLEPRIISLYKIKDNIGIHASFSRTTQNIFQLSNNSLGLPTDVWIGSNQGIPVSSALNYALGASMEHKMYALSVDVYYRKLDGMLRYNPGSNFLLNGVDWKNRLQLNGSGMTYGLETLIKKNSGRVTGWLAYTYSRSFRTFSSINEGKKFNFQFDRPHELDIVMAYKINDKWDFSVNWKWASGNPTNIPIASVPSIYFDQINLGINLSGIGISNDLFEIPPVKYENTDGNSINIYDGFNKYRLPYYHRLDLGINRRIKKKTYEIIINMSVYNAYSRKNALFVYVGFEDQVLSGFNAQHSNQKTVINRFNQFPIIPSLSFTLNF